jgi:hypothetical protein
VNDSVDPVELSPTRTELIARVQRRGRQLRARRRVGITALAALVVIAIAVPAVAIGTRSSSSRHAPPATAARGEGDLRVALVTSLTRPPCEDGTFVTPVTAACARLGRVLATGDDVKAASARYDPTRGGWFVQVRLSRPAIERIVAAAPARAAIVVAGRVWSVQRLSADISGATIDIVTDHMRPKDAIALADKIMSGAPVPNLTARIELPGHEFVVGSEVHGSLVVENPTDKPVSLSTNGCNQWAAVLTNADFPPQRAFTTQGCLGFHVVLRPGSNRYPFVLVTTLPLGRYEAVLYADPHEGTVFPAPPPVSVTLVAKGGAATKGGFTSHIELPGDTFVAGVPVHGTLVVENDTGRVVSLPMDSNGCRIPWVVELTNYASVPVAPPIVRSVCLSHAVVLTPGASEFAFTLVTTYSNCTPLKPVGNAVACLPGTNGRPPPLPLGDYTAVLQPVGVVPTPPPVTVHLVAASGR